MLAICAKQLKKDKRQTGTCKFVLALQRELEKNKINFKTATQDEIKYIETLIIQLYKIYWDHKDSFRKQVRIKCCKNILAKL